MRWCDRNNVGYIIGLARNQVLERLSEQWTTQSKEQFEQTEQKQRIFGEFMYAAGTWDCKRRVIVKAEYLEKGANTRFIVTNLKGKPQQLYDELYYQRPVEILLEDKDIPTQKIITELYQKNDNHYFLITESDDLELPKKIKKRFLKKNMKKFGTLAVIELVVREEQPPGEIVDEVQDVLPEKFKWVDFLQ